MKNDNTNLDLLRPIIQFGKNLAVDCGPLPSKSEPVAIERSNMAQADASFEEAECVAANKGN